jgi:hypothetical protein
MIKRVLIPASMVLIGVLCIGNVHAAGSQQQAAAEMPKDLVFAHSSVGGAWHAISEAITELWRRQGPALKWSTVPGGSAGNLNRLSIGEVDLAMSTNTVSFDAMNALPPFEKPLQNIRSITGLYTSYVQYFVMTRTGLTSLDEIIEKKYPLRVSVHTKGSGIEVNAQRVLKFYGLTYADIESWGGRVVFVGMSDAASMMGDGQLDAYFVNTLAPIAALTELSLRQDVTLLKINPGIVKMFIDDYGHGDGYLPSGTYKGQNEPLYSFTDRAAIYARADLPDEIVYQLTKIIAENIGEVRTIHAMLKDMTVDEMWRDLGYPLHPGAERYYREKGLLATK